MGVLSLQRFSLAVVVYHTRARPGKAPATCHLYDIPRAPRRMRRFDRTDRHYDGLRAGRWDLGAVFEKATGPELPP